MNKLLAFVKDESGATAIEYGLIASLISITAILLMSQIGDELQETFQSVKEGLQKGQDNAK
ncbi:MAG: Flp family type IVb pilin [Rickettsiales bacterium]|nr:Flp family type IVb pilin [Rickettsiales bacterium]